MSTNRVDAALHKIDDALDKAASRSIQALAPFVQKESEENEIYACFELWWEQDYSLGYNKYYVKNIDGRQKLDVDYSETNPDGSSFLPEILEFFNSYYENLSKDTEFTQEEGVDFSQKLESSLFSWFARCWQAAGGENSKIPTYFCFEKEYKVRDLKTGELMGEVEAAQKLGHDVVSFDSTG